MNESRPVVALFDFDGTITTRDSLLPFLWFSFGFWGTFKIILTAFPKITRFALGYSSRQEAKEAILTAAFKGMTPAELVVKAKEYVDTRLGHLVKQEAIERILWHEKQGHRCAVVSASLSTYLQFWVKEWGITDLLCSELALDDQGKFTGNLIGKNCWGPEKVRRVEMLLGDIKKFTIYAYGDSRGDKELLEIADKPFYRRWSE